MRWTLWLTLLLVLVTLSFYSDSDGAPYELSPHFQPMLSLELVQSWCYHVVQNNCTGIWRQPQSNAVDFEGLPGVCDVAFAIPRAVPLETDQGVVYHLTSFTSEPRQVDAIVYASRNIIVVDGICRITVTLLP
jgi:hypothetical protein